MDDIQNSWEENAHEWIKIIDKQAIPSRKYTNEAIVEVCRNLKPKNLLDVGCGEGWLTRSIGNFAKLVVGTDAIETLIENAKKKGKGTYYKITYQDFIDGYQLKEAPFDLVVFNFSIYQKDDLDLLLGMLKKQLVNNGHIVIQTLHPNFLVNQNLNNESQWIDDAWKGLPGNFVNGHKWYARTLDDWKKVFNAADLSIESTKEVFDENSKTLSIIFILK